MVLFSIPIGILVDRRNRVRLTIGLALLWTLGTSLTAFAPSAGLLTAARMLVGIGSTGSLTAALSLCADFRSEEHTSELQSLMRISYAVFCLKKKKRTTYIKQNKTQTTAHEKSKHTH